MKRARRVRFTRAELEIIDEMCAIASATGWGEGDYQSWDDKRAKPFDSLQEKVGELLDRMPRCRECDLYPCVCRKSWLAERKLSGV